MKDKKIAKIIKKLLKNKTVCITSHRDPEYPERSMIYISGSCKIIRKLNDVLFEGCR